MSSGRHPYAGVPETRQTVTPRHPSDARFSRLQPPPRTTSPRHQRCQRPLHPRLLPQRTSPLERRALPPDASATARSIAGPRAAACAAAISHQHRGRLPCQPMAAAPPAKVAHFRRSAAARCSYRPAPAGTRGRAAACTHVPPLSPASGHLRRRATRLAWRQTPKWASSYQQKLPAAPSRRPPSTRAGSCHRPQKPVPGDQSPACNRTHRQPPPPGGERPPRTKAKTSGQQLPWPRRSSACPTAGAPFRQQPPQPAGTSPACQHLRAALPASSRPRPPAPACAHRRPPPATTDGRPRLQAAAPAGGRHPYQRAAGGRPRRPAAPDSPRAPAAALAGGHLPCQPASHVAPLSRRRWLQLSPARR